jgi:hypothetical protein
MDTSLEDAAMEQVSSARTAARCISASCLFPKEESGRGQRFLVPRCYIELENQGFSLTACALGCSTLSWQNRRRGGQLWR